MPLVVGQRVWQHALPEVDPRHHDMSRGRITLREELFIRAYLRHAPPLWGGGAKVHHALPEVTFSDELAQFLDRAFENPAVSGSMVKQTVKIV